MPSLINCSKCGKEHWKTTSNCCWISCTCGAHICGLCGGTNISNMDLTDDEAQYWCGDRCGDCGLEGCAMCV